MNVQPRSLLILVLASTGFALATPFTFAADRPAQGDPITALLSEVRALRLTTVRGSGAPCPAPRYSFEHRGTADSKGERSTRASASTAVGCEPRVEENGGRVGRGRK